MELGKIFSRIVIDKILSRGITWRVPSLIAPVAHRVQLSGPPEKRSTSTIRTSERCTRFRFRESDERNSCSNKQRGCTKNQ